MKNKPLFIGINALLVIIVGSIFALTANQIIFSTFVGILSFVVLLVFLCLPTLIFFLQNKAPNEALVALFILLAFEIVVNLIFMFNPKFAVLSYGITQAIGLAVFLASLLIIIGMNNNQNN